MMVRAEDKIVKSRPPAESKEILKSYTKIIAASIGPTGGKVWEVGEGTVHVKFVL